MKKFIVLIGVLLVSLLTACGLIGVRGSGNVISESRSVSNFSRVSLSGSGELIITQGGGESLTIEADDNLMQYLESEVRGDTLHLGSKRNTNVNPTRAIRYNLGIIELNSLNLSGSGRAEANSIDTDSLDIGVSGSGNVRINTLGADSLTVRISGSGEFELGGRVVDQEIRISGSGDYFARELESKTTKITVSGSGKATVWVIDSLDVNISGSGSVDYYGQPAINMLGSGSGNLNNLGTP